MKKFTIKTNDKVLHEYEPIDNTITTEEEEKLLSFDNHEVEKIEILFTEKVTVGQSKDLSQLDADNIVEIFLIVKEPK